MKQTKNVATDAGSAAIEFLVFGLVAQLVIAGFGLDLLRQQRAQILSQSIARQTVRLVIADPLAAPSRVSAMLDQISNQQGRPVTDFKVSWLPLAPSPQDWVIVKSVVSGQTELAVMRATK